MTASGEPASTDTEIRPPGALRIDITPHKRQPGTQRPFVASVGELEGIELPSVEVAADTVTCDLLIEIVGEQLTAVGTLSSEWTGPCRRCLEPVTDTAVVKIQEIFELEPVEGETYKLEKDFCDLRPMVIETMVLSLPIAPLCSEDCAGPAPDQFPTEPAVDEPAAEPAGDPRWAALDALNFGGSDADPSDESST